MTFPSDRAGAVLTIDLGAIARNYRTLRDRLDGAGCAAVVKADAYGLGVERVAPVLARAGCTVFFVATLDEGIALRRILGEASIMALDGAFAGCEAEFAEHDLVPVLNDLGQIARWQALARERNVRLDAVVHIDTGMNRLGLPACEVDVLAEAPERLDGLRLALVMSHLACAEDRAQPMNARQRDAFAALRTRLPAAPASLANSSGIFLGSDYHFDLARPGVALYGVNPTPDAPNPMAEVVRLQGKILQVRDVDSPQTVGYGAAHRVAAPGRIATVPVGYADGYHRALGNRAFAAIGDVRVPVVGRVSMDLITLDVTGVPPGHALPGAAVDLIGGACPVEEVAAWADTIGYEILTSLGRRYARRYVGGTA
ncbi:MAG: alanine racemase [Alphaproteobacteria bacterium]